MRISNALSRAFFENQKVILAIRLGEIVAGDLAEAGVLHLGAHNGLVKTMVRARAVTVNDAEASAWLQRRAQIGKHQWGMRDFVVNLQHQGGVERAGCELGVVGCAQNRFYVGQLLALGPLLNVSDGLGVNFLRDDPPIGSNAAGSTDTKPASAGANISDDAPGFELQKVHHAVDLQALPAARVFKDAKVAGVRRAGGVGSRRLRLKDWGKNSNSDGDENEEQIATKGHRIWMHKQSGPQGNLPALGSAFIIFPRKTKTA
jgi:hypothetical protein